MISGPQQGKSAADGGDSGGGDTPWSNVGNAVSQDGSSATSSIPAEGKTNYLDVTNFGPFPRVAASDIIDTITIEVRCSKDTGAPTWTVYDPIMAGTPAGVEISPGGSPAVPGSLDYISSFAFDPAGDLGVPMTGADVNAGNWGARFVFNGDNSVTSIVSVDAVRITLTGTFTGPIVKYWMPNDQWRDRPASVGDGMSVTGP